jgi:energy-coupling factor transport system permease protein
MTLRFIPDFTEQFGKVYRSRRAAGYGGKNEKNPIKKILANISEGLHVTSTVVTWSLERAIVTSDSMKARGYGLKKRTAYSIFSMDKRDVCCLIYILLTGLYVLVGAVYGSFDFWYYPCILTKTRGLYEDSVFICYGMLAAMPIVMHVYEVKKWKIIESKK